MIREETLRLGFVLVLAALLLSVPTFAQEQTGSVSGTVMDADGGAIPGVSVTITGPSFSKTVVTNAKGFYRIPALQPGTYSVAAELDGFQKSEYSKVRVSLGGRLELDFTVHPDTVKEVIEVTAEAPIISLRASDTSAVISKEWVDKLPTGRDFTDVVSQVAGASDEDDLLRRAPMAYRYNSPGPVYNATLVAANGAAQGNLGRYSEGFAMNSGVYVGMV